MNKHLNKQGLRKQLKAKLNAAHDFNSLNSNLSENLKSLISELNFGQESERKIKLGGYNPIQVEPHWFVNFGDADFEYSVVHMHNELKLSYHPIQLAELKAGELGLQLSEDKLSELVDPDVILIPGLGYTETLERLGRGKAYFDTFLKDYKGIKIGVFYSLQEVEDVLSEAHDEKLDYIVTDKKIIRGNKNDN